MIVHRSNRIEALVDALAEVVATPVADPFAPEWIGVQSAGMGRWLGLELARRLGIWANPAFPFPRTLIDTAASAFLDADAPAHAAAAFDPAILRWAIAAELPACLGEPAFAPLRGYLADDARGVKAVQLAGRIADLFDQYAVYRPDMVLGWERRRGPGRVADDADWQALLWRRLVRRLGSGHAAARAEALAAALAAGGAPAPGVLPPRVSLFGLSTLPPLYVQLLAALAAHFELHVFLLSPSREYWAETRSRRESIRDALRRRSPADPDALAAAEGHPLLASFGRIGRELQYVLEASADYVDAPQDRYVDPGQGSLLAALQSDILALRSRAPDERLPLAAGDESIAVHACHGPMREIEVLHDQLVALFDADPTLEPQHVVVMAPAIDAYAPVIEAVFASGGRPPIPFRIADRRARAEQDVTDAFLRTLELLEGRLPASAVFDLVSLPPVRERFDIAAEELDRIREWIAESGIRWGADAPHRAEESQPLCADNTWAFGLERLLLGYAVPAAGEPLFEGVLPHDDAEGSEAELLGRFAELATALCRLRATLRAPRPPLAWRPALETALETMIASSPETAYQHQQLAEALVRIAAAAETGGFTGSVELGVMRALLERELEARVSPRGFLTGAVTFCELVPMRSIPFRVVCLIGLNDGAFPRVRRPLGFDRMAARRRAGDRTPRDDDRYLFLEALLAARDRLLITYVGQRIHDSTVLPPSVVVDELLDAIDRAAVDPTGRPARARIVCRHPLQPFSPRYFGRDPDPRLFSYAWGHHAAAAALIGPRAPALPFLAAPLPVEPCETVALDDLVRFFRNPTRWFLQRRLGLFLGRDAEPLADREPIELASLEQWKIGDTLLQRVLEGVDPEDAWARLRATGTLPLGMLGRHAFATALPSVTAIAAAARAARAGAERRPAAEVDVAVGGTRVTGALRDLWPGGQLFVQYAKIGGRHELQAWIHHLVHCASQRDPGPTLLIGRGGEASGAAIVRFPSLADPWPHLAELLRLFQMGQTAPLPLFAHASCAFAEAVHAGATTAVARQRAERKFADERNGGDLRDDYVAEVYRQRSPLADEEIGAFTALATAVYGPLLAAREALP